ncbi:MAG: NAD(P)H-dependent oxidoreductase [Henriciella sp.]|nr:NAD(P)H-dependent oxidoreductase [Henriciella sp.]
MKILAFSASNSRQSINATLVRAATEILTTKVAQDAEIDFVDIHDFEMPIYSIDRETEDGIPQLANDFLEKIGGVDALLIGYAEHNGNYTAAYKNLFDWMSRLGRDIFQNKPMVIMGTSPGKGGASSVLKLAETSAPFFAGEIVATVSLPRYHETFDAEAGKIKDADKVAEMETALRKLAESLA